MNEYRAGMGTTPGMWEMLSEVLAVSEEKLPESLNRAIYALRDREATVVPKELASAAPARAEPSRSPGCSIADPLQGKYGGVLTPFIELMNNELHANAGKGDRPGWLSLSTDQAMLEIYYHAAKLQKAVKDGDLAGVREYSADVANMAMMMLDICGGLCD